MVAKIKVSEAEICGAYLSGLSMTAVGEKYGVSAKPVDRILRANNITRRSCCGVLRPLLTTKELVPCLGCGENLPASTFGPPSSGAGRCRSKCLDCRNVQKKCSEYGLTRDEYLSLQAKCGNKCSICGSKPKRNHLCVDHCHETGKVRGLLCHTCNSGIGLLGDNANGLLRAYNYLRNNQ